MISLADIQNAYVDLYTQLRKYIWDYDVAEDIAELEIASFKAFPELVEVSDKLVKLESRIREVVEQDEDLKSALDNFIKLVSEDTSCYYKLCSVIEGSPV